MNPRIRPIRRSPRIRRSAAIALAIGAVMVTGCGARQGDAVADAEPTIVESSASGASGATAPSPSAASSIVSPTPQSSSGASLRDALLPAADLPGFNDEFTWQEARTMSSEPPQLAGTCHRFELASIGAEDVAYRAYRHAEADTVTASELVAQFPDDETAARAYAVLQSWRDECAEQIGRFERAKVGSLTEVDPRTRGGVSTWYLLTYGPVADDPDAAHFDAQGLVLMGDRVAALRLALIGQDYNYARGEEPMVAALRAAAARL